MEAPDRFEITGRIAAYRPVGRVTFDEGVERIAAAIALARAEGVCEMLVNTTGLTGFGPSSTFQRFDQAVRWAAASGGYVRLAIVAVAAMIDVEKFGVTVAANRGVTSDVFTTEAEALAWLNTDPAFDRD